MYTLILIAVSILAVKWLLIRLLAPLHTTDFAREARKRDREYLSAQCELEEKMLESTRSREEQLIPGTPFYNRPGERE